jgi:hypothetical protein
VHVYAKRAERHGIEVSVNFVPVIQIFPLF